MFVIKHLSFVFSVALVLCACNNPEPLREQKNETNDSLTVKMPPPEYFTYCSSADSLYATGKYKDAAEMYSRAMKSYGWKGTPFHRYNGACCWALAGVPDSALFYLDRAVRGGYSDYGHISNDPDLNSLHADKRWNELLEKVKANKEKTEANLNKPLVHQLDSILEEDQKYRIRMDRVEKKYGWESKEMKELWKKTSVADSINLMKVKAILDKHGWLGSDVIGNEGNMTLFLVIQHADPLTQEKYLPMMREAVKQKKADGGQLAMLEDRVALSQGKRQIYGSQLSMDQKTGKYYLSPMEDPDNVDKRRAEVGLPPIQEYLNHWNIKWDVEQYKKELPELDKKDGIKK